MKIIISVFGSLFKFARLSSALLISYWLLSRHFPVLERMQSGQWSWLAFAWYLVAVIAVLSLMVSWGGFGWRHLPEDVIAKIWDLDKDVFLNSNSSQLRSRFGFWGTEKRAWTSYAYSFGYILNATSRIASLLLLVLLSLSTGGRFFRKPALRLLELINN